MDWRSKIAQDFDRLAPSWDQKHGPASPKRIALRLRSAWLRNLCASYGRPRLLDVGCGTGQQLLALAGDLGEGVGIDISPVMIERARHNAGESGLGDRLRFQVLAAEDVTPAGLGTFDLVLFGASLEHMANPQPPLARAAEVLRANGAVILVLVHPWHPRGLYARLAAKAGAMPDLHPLSPGALRRCAAAAGLQPTSRFGPARRHAREPRHIKHRIMQGLLAPAAFGSYLAVLIHGDEAPPAPRE